LKFGQVVFELRKQTGKQTDERTCWSQTRPFCQFGNLTIRPALV